MPVTKRLKNEWPRTEVRPAVLQQPFVGCAFPKLLLSEAHKRLTRECLFTAGEAEFRIRGYNETTAEKIATSAGTSRARFYAYFKSKAEVVLELMKRSEPDLVSAYSDLHAITKPTSKDHGLGINRLTRVNLDQLRVVP